MTATPKRGRPTDSKKDYMLRVRLDNETRAKLEEIEMKTSQSKSEIIRNGIVEQFDRLK
ncbi:TPA: CopG family transcriptional regulator [Streptococcus suis]|nr:CopG family transcriptional regulator [Streptococcus suis]NQJ30264.1 CopG family transcriptional regulator [Streptococcus suis]NQM16650.1 CopG family transcriptional regulator [Streptococcus suis]NQO33348.1 CopG family transcriptional regulator [Streptococcus suis]NQP16937.1 CopG family transcriptional regulator [Streptococcus suis]